MKNLATSLGMSEDTYNLVGGMSTLVASEGTSAASPYMSSGTSSASTSSTTETTFTNSDGSPYDLLKQRGIPTTLDDLDRVALDSGNYRMQLGITNYKYQVGLYDEIKGAEGFDAHHVGQKAVMGRLVDNYDLNTAPAINIPKVGHTRRGPSGVVSRSTKGFENARQVVARDIMELRRVYPDIPNSKLEELIDLNKKLYPEVRSRNND